MAETVDKGSPSYAVATVPAFEEEADEDRCVRILATFGLDLSRAVDPDSAALAAVPAFEEETDEDRCVRILATFGLDLSRAVDPDSAAPALPLGADLVRPAPPALLHLAGVAWKAPFYVIAGGVGAILGSLRLGARALHTALAFLRFSAAGTDAVGNSATLLPDDILLDIACRLGPPRSNVQAMRSVCQTWRAGVPNTNGPVLLMSGLDQILALQMAPSEGSLVRCPWFSQPPHASLWGAANGFVALQKEGTSDLYLYCTNCAKNNVHLPRLPAGYTTGSRLEMAPEEDDIRNGGVFFHGLPVTRFAILCSGYPTMFTDQHIDGHGRHWWAFYPGTEDIPMSSVGFLDATHLVAVSADLRVVIGPVQATYPAPGSWSYPVISEPLVSLDIPVEGPPLMLPWDNYGNHVFTCGDRVYVCVMLRSVSDEDEANQALVLPGTLSNNQLPNTIYIADDDMVNITTRIWSVNIASGDTDSIPFPPGVNPRQYERAAWAAPPPLNMPFWHCDTTMAR